MFSTAKATHSSFMCKRASRPTLTTVQADLAV
jgi:hypothetical protein